MNKTFDQVFRQVYKDMTMITEKTRENYDQRHGGAFDRGAADSYYQRGRTPHMYEGGTGTSRRIEQAEMTPAEVQAYIAGYQWNEQFGDKKSWD
jgi:hypothetical protein